MSNDFHDTQFKLLAAALISLFLSWLIGYMILGQRELVFGVRGNILHPHPIAHVLQFITIGLVVVVAYRHIAVSDRRKAVAVSSLILVSLAGLKIAYLVGFVAGPSAVILDIDGVVTDVEVRNGPKHVEEFNVELSTTNVDAVEIKKGERTLQYVENQSGSMTVSRWIQDANPGNEYRIVAVRSGKTVGSAHVRVEWLWPWQR